MADFTFLERIGHGSFGTVFKVKRKADGGLYVVKQVKILTMSRKEQEAAINEVRILASLNSPYVIRYYDSFIDGDSLNIVMELAENGTLSDALKRSRLKNLPERTVWKYFIQLTLGIYHIHQRNIVHRDLKALNVLLDADDCIKIADLGVAKVLTTHLRAAHTGVGTPYYLSPEVAQQKPYNAKSDVWALGCILYELCTRRHPFVASTQAQLFQQIVRGSYRPISSQYGRDVARLIKVCLTRDVGRRPTPLDLIRRPEFVAKAEELGIELPAGVSAAAVALATGGAVSVPRAAAASSGGPVASSVPPPPRRPASQLRVGQSQLRPLAAAPAAAKRAARPASARERASAPAAVPRSSPPPGRSPPQLARKSVGGAATVQPTPFGAVVVGAAAKKKMPAYMRPLRRPASAGMHRRGESQVELAAKRRQALAQRPLSAAVGLRQTAAAAKARQVPPPPPPAQQSLVAPTPAPNPAAAAAAATRTPLRQPVYISRVPPPPPRAAAARASALASGAGDADAPSARGSRQAALPFRAGRPASAPVRLSVRAPAQRLVVRQGEGEARQGGALARPAGVNLIAARPTRPSSARPSIHDMRKVQSKEAAEVAMLPGY